MENGFLIVGLGNPGPKYESTRHNVGFMVVDELFSRADGMGWQEKFQGMFTKVRLGRTPMVLLKPMTYMNLSGKSVARAANFHRFDLEQVIVIHDDLDLEYGTIRIKEGGGTGGHKGITSCKTEMGDPGFTRIRIGIGRPAHGNVTNFVLEKFTPDEQIELDSVVKTASDAVQCVADFGIIKAMNQFNKRQGDNK